LLRTTSSARLVTYGLVCSGIAALVGREPADVLLTALRAGTESPLGEAIAVVFAVGLALPVPGAVVGAVWGYRAGRRADRRAGATVLGCGLGFLAGVMALWLVNAVRVLGILGVLAVG
jgi:hypothetical protein